MSVRFDYTEYLQNAFLKSITSSGLYQSETYTAGSSYKPFYSYVNPGHSNNSSSLEISSNFYVSSPTCYRWDIKPDASTVWTTISSGASFGSGKTQAQGFYDTSGLALPALVRLVIKTTSNTFVKFTNIGYSTAFGCAVRVMGNITT